MTKSWDEVREYVCRLYQIERKSLRQIEETLLRERQFKASTRAYRAKLKEWRVKRDGRYLNAHDQPTTLCCKQSISCQHSDGQANSVHSSANGYGSIHNESEGSASIPTAVVTPLPVPHIRLPAHLSGNDVQLGLKSVLERTAFVEGQDTILHKIARERETKLNRFYDIVSFMQSHHISIDIRDRGGETALEAAIQTGNYLNVVCLLSKGASVTTRNAIGQQPLHISLTANISNKSDICQALLTYNADPTSSISTGIDLGDNATVTFLKHIENRIFLGDRRGDYDLCLGMLDRTCALSLALFSQDIEFDPRHGSAFRRFLQGWWAPVHHKNPEDGSEMMDSDALAVKCLKCFLRKGFDPCTIGSAGYLCPQGRCNDFASLAFFHATDTTCSDSIIECSDSQYTHRLFNLWLEPCQSRIVAGRSRSMSDQLRIFLNKHTLPDDYFSNFLGSPAMLYLEDPETLDMLRIITESKKCGLDGRDSRGRRPVEYLAHIPEPRRWQVAEIVLSKEVATRAKGCYYDTDKLFSPSDFPLAGEDMDAYLGNHLGRLQRYIARGCTKSHVPYSHCACQETLGSEDGVLQLQRCIIHVISKHIWDDSLRGLTSFWYCAEPGEAELIAYIVEMRRKSGLPGIQIDSGDFHELLKELNGSRT